MNIKKHYSTICLLLAVITSTFAQAQERWRNPEIFAVNKAKSHAEFIIFDNEAEALKPVDLKNPWNGSFYQSLNGKWDFQWYKNWTKVPTNWFNKRKNMNNWSKIDVPGTWQDAGFDRFYYLNLYMPFEYDWSTGERAPGFEEGNNEEVKEKGFIPDNAQRVGIYHRRFDLSKEKLDQKVSLRIGAIEAGVVVCVNNKEVGYSQGSLTPAEFDISNYVKAGENTVALKVYRWTDGSYMEVQDMIRFAGIYRDVFLRFEPKQHIRDIYFIGVPDKNLTTVNTTYKVVVANDDKKKANHIGLHFDLLPEGSTTPVKSWDETVSFIGGKNEIEVSGTFDLKGMKLWSPDQPNLYRLLVSLNATNGTTTEVARIDAGFKRFEDIDGNLHLNGNRFHIRGVNRHDHHPKYGRHVPVKNMIRDLELMKQNNINTVRTSHYPNDERWYYLCNRYGMALIDEANVESHGFEDLPGNRPQWTAAATDRVESMVRRDKNNPSILLWSLGNEQGAGWNLAFEAQFQLAKKIDPTRLVMCDRANRILFGDNPALLDKPNVVTPMYKVFDRAGAYLANRSVDRRPFFMCEYRHAMGNSVGSLKEVWDFFYNNEENGLNGGCIWDWIDQGVEAKSADGRTYYQYGGDWGDKATHHNFCLNGLVLPDQGWTPKLAEVKKCYEPFTMDLISTEKGYYSVFNRLNQKGLDQFNCSWQLLENGIVIQSGKLPEVVAKPREKQTFQVKIDHKKLSSEKEYFIRFAYSLKNDELWAKAGHEITFTEFPFRGEFSYSVDKGSSKPTIKRRNGKLTIKASPVVSVAFNEQTGELISYAVKGKELLVLDKRDRLFDNTQAWIDNLFSIKRDLIKLGDYRKFDLEHIKRKGKASIKVTEESDCTVVQISNCFMSSKNAGYGEVQTWTIYGSGQIEVRETVKPMGELKPGMWIPRIGLRFPLTPTLDQVRFYGLGPHGNYSDRSYGAWTAIHSSTVMENYTPYPVPQDNGNHGKVRWMEVTNHNGIGLKIVASTPLTMGALPYTQDQLEAARHTIDLPKQPTTTELRIAAKVTGIGNNSCGPTTLDCYKTLAGDVEYRFVIVPVL